MKNKNPIICFVTPYSPREVSGVSKFVDELRITLKKRNIDSFVITRLVKPEIKTWNQFIEINCHISPRFKGIYLGIRTAIEILKLRKTISILHLQTPLPQSALAAVMGRILGIPVVITVHGVFPESKNKLENVFYRLMCKITFLSANETTFVSKMSKRYYNILSGKLIFNGVDINNFSFNSVIRATIRNKLCLEDKFVFLFAGRVTFPKGIEEIINATSIIKNFKNNIKILVVGPITLGETKDYYSKIREAGIDNYIINLGVQNRMNDFYCASDVLLLPSYFEGLPLVILEAMSCGLPVIASKVGEIPFVIENYRNGLLIEPRSVEDLIEKMMWCIENEDKLVVLGKNAAKTVRNRFSMERVADEYISIYEKYNTNVYTNLKP